jgi:Polyphosphate kinase N-terminal domain
MTDKVVTEAVIEAGVETAQPSTLANGTEHVHESAGTNSAEPTHAEAAPVQERRTRRTRRRSAPPTNGAGAHSAAAAAAAGTMQAAEPADQQPELTGAMSERYVTFLHNFQRDRTLPPHPIIEPGYDITTLSIDELSSSDEVYNRELSWLDFNWRVLHEAVDSRTPLLERLKFIAITSSNLDEYFSKRVGGLKRQKAAGVANLTPCAR